MPGKVPSVSGTEELSFPAEGTTEDIAGDRMQIHAQIQFEACCLMAEIIDDHAVENAGVTAVGGAGVSISPTSDSTGRQKGRNRSSGAQLTMQAKRELVLSFLDDHVCWDGTLAELQDGLKKKKGLEISRSTLWRYLKGSKYQRLGHPPRVAKIPGKPGCESEAVSFDPPADMPDVDAWTMPEEDEPSH